MSVPKTLLASLLVLAATALARAAASDYFRIAVVDDQTGRGVPLVELETVNGLIFMTDSNGLVAFNEPGFMGQETYSFVRSHGYEIPKDGFGNAGVRLRPAAGGSAQIKIKRLNIAERLYRITGEGIYRDTVLLGEKTPLRKPVLDGQVLGQDSVMAVPYRGKLYWFWGDTNRASYPLGHFGTSGATSLLPGQGGLDPAAGVDLDYFVDNTGFSRKMCPNFGEGLIWIEGVLTVPDEKGQERLITQYMRMKGLGEMLDHGIAVFNDEKGEFEKIVTFKLDDRWRCPQAHPVRVKDEGVDYFYFPVPFPTVRVKANWNDVMNPEAYQAFTCLAPGSPNARGEVERDAQGKVVYAWKPTTYPTGQREERALIAAGKLKPEEAHFQIRDIDSDRPVEMHGGSVYWNDHLKRWLMIAVQTGGSSFLGEVWLAEAPAPTGPWTYAKKIVTHDKYTFYNPAQHPFFDQQGGRIIYFEGTYANTFSGNEQRTPRYDYNQIMYRVDLDDARLGKLHKAVAP
jgi:hypothetical protein